MKHSEQLKYQPSLRSVLKKRARRKVWLKRTNVERNRKSKPKKRRTRNPRRSYYRNIKKIIIPADFSLRTNIEGVLEVIHGCKILNTRKTKEIMFDFRNVRTAAPGAMIILLSNVMELAEKGVIINGNYPRNRMARRQMERTGFLQRLRAPVSAENLNTPNMIVEYGANETNQEKTAVAIRAAMKKVWGQEDRNTKIQGMFIELMANTINHAFKTDELKKQWYLSLDFEFKQEAVEFCFLDNGAGILRTINLKFQDRIKQLFSSSSDILIKEAFLGTFGSRTGIKHRGRGLVSVKRVFEEGVIKEFKVVTNDVYLDFGTNRAKILKRPFDGTFYYWVLDKSCKE